MTVIVFFLTLSLLIVVHEFGHFITARRLGVKVEKFSIGFGRPIFKKKIKDFDFLIGWILFGGYVKMAGDEARSFTRCPNEYLAKSPGRRALIVVAGPFFNYLLAWVIFFTIFLMGLPTFTTKVGKLLEDYPAIHSGLQEGDVITTINSEKVTSWTEMAEIIHNFRGEYLKLSVKRNEEILNFTIKPKRITTKNIFGKEYQIAMVGIKPSQETFILKYSPPKAFIESVQYLFKLTFLTLKGFFYIFTGTIPVRESMRGPLGIYFIMADAYKMGMLTLLQFLGILSMNLCIVNLLPLPVLDGGHLFFLSIEKLRKKPLSPKVEGIITQIGLAIIILIAVFVLYNDVVLKFGSK